MNWQLLAVFVVPFAVAAFSVWLDRRLRDRPRIIAYFSHGAAVRLDIPDKGALDVHTHALVIRNTGRKAAQNVRVFHRYLPTFSVYPDSIHDVVASDDGGGQIIFPVFPPGKTVNLNYLYFGPVVWSDTSTHIECEDSDVQVIKTIHTRQVSSRLVLLIGALATIGAATAAYGLWELALWVDRLRQLASG